MSATPQSNATLPEIAGALLAHDRFAICGHVNPDGDCIGSTLGLAHALRALGKEVRTLVADEEPLDRSLAFMEGFAGLVPASAAKPAEVFVTVDAPNDERIGRAASELKAASALTITIDHHAVPKRASDLSYTDPESASTTLLVWELAKLLGVPQEGGALAAVATCCYAGLLTDTGRFMYQNANLGAFAGAAEMVECGVRPAFVATELFQHRTEASVKLDAIAVERMRTFGNGAALSWITLDDMEGLHASKHDAENAIAPIRSIDGIDVACLLKEREGCVRGSLRAKDGTDVAAIAREFGGGGHVSAAGFTLDRTLGEAISTMERRLALL